MSGKPIRRIPILRRELFAQRKAELGEIKVAAILRFEPRVIHSKERYRFGSGRKFHHSEKLGRGRNRGYRGNSSLYLRIVENYGLNTE